MATTQSIDSRKIIAHRGIGVGVAIMGGRSGGYENTLQEGRVAVAGADLDDKVVVGSMLMISVSDTAVVLA